MLSGLFKSVPFILSVAKLALAANVIDITAVTDGYATASTSNGITTVTPNAIPSTLTTSSVYFHTIEARDIVNASASPLTSAVITPASYDFTFGTVYVPIATYAWTGGYTRTIDTMRYITDFNNPTNYVLGSLILMPEITLITWTGTTTSNSIIVTSQYHDLGRFVSLTTYTMLEVPTPLPATHTYEYTGDVTTTSTLTYGVLYNAAISMTTDVALLVPESTLTIWTGTGTSTILVTATAIDATGQPTLTTYTQFASPISIGNTYAWTGTYTMTTKAKYYLEDPTKRETIGYVLLIPETTLSTWTGTTTRTSIVITSELVDFWSACLTTYTMLEVPSSTAKNNFGYTGDAAAITSTLISNTTDGALGSTTTAIDAAGTAGASSASTGITASETYEYTGTSTITSTLVYTTTNVEGKDITVTEVAVLVPETTLTTWTGSFITSVVITATAVDADGKPFVTTYAMVQLPHSAVSTSTWSKSFSSTIVTTVGTIVTTIVCIPSSTAASTDTADESLTKAVYGTMTWSNSYASTIVTTIGTTVSTIVYIPSSSTIVSVTSTECAQCGTSIWSKSTTSTATTTISGVVLTIVCVPNSTASSSNQKTTDTASNRLTDSTETMSTALMNFGTNGTTGVIGATGTFAKTEVLATTNITPTGTKTLDALILSSHSSAQPSAAVYAGSGYKLKNSFVLALVAYMLAI
jgi:hypothetical protein